MKKINQWALIVAAFFTQSFSIPQGVSEVYLNLKYSLALQDAASVEKGEDFNDLIPIIPSNSQIKWDEKKSQILVVTWKSQDNYDKFIKNQTNTSPSEEYVTWVTVAPQLQDFCQQYLRNNPGATPEELTLRLKQYLGLPPAGNYEIFVEMWVTPEDIFRPCVNPSIEARKCDLDFPEKETPKVKNIQNYKLFYQNLYYKSFRPVKWRQPWTGLGYTYDWSDSASHVGASEFILVPGARYQIHQEAVPTMEYCRPSGS